MTIPIVSYSDERLYGEIFEWPGKSVAAFVFAYDHLESTPSTLFEKIRSLAGSIILGIVFSISIHTLLGPLFLLGRFIKICHYHCLPMLAKIQEIVQSYWNLQQPSESDKAAELAKILKNDLSDQNLRESPLNNLEHVIKSALYQYPYSSDTLDDLAQRIEVIIDGLPHSSLSADRQTAFKEKLCIFSMFVTMTLMDISSKQIQRQLPFYGISRRFVDLICIRLNEQHKSVYMYDSMEKYAQLLTTLCSQENLKVDFFQSLVDELHLLDLLSTKRLIDISILKLEENVYIKGCKMLREHPEVLSILQSFMFIKSYLRDYSLRNYVSYCRAIEPPSDFNLDHVEVDLEATKCIEKIPDHLTYISHLLNPTWKGDIKQIRQAYVKKLLGNLLRQDHSPQFYQRLVEILKKNDVFSNSISRWLKNVLVCRLDLELQKVDPHSAHLTVLEEIIDVILSNELATFSNRNVQLLSKRFSSLSKRLGRKPDQQANLTRLHGMMVHLAVGFEAISLHLLGLVKNKTPFADQLEEIYKQKNAQKFMSVFISFLVVDPDLSFEDRYEGVLSLIEFEKEVVGITQEVRGKYFLAFRRFVEDDLKNERPIFQDPRLFQAIFDQKEGWMSHVTSLLKSTFTIGKLYPFPLEWLNGREDRPLMLEFYCETYFQWIELHKTLQDPENPNRFIPPENFIETLFGYVRALEDSLDQAWLLFFVFKLLAKEMSIQTAPDVERYQSLVQSWMLFIESLEPELCHHILELIKTLPLSPKSDFLLDVDVTFFEGLCHCVEEQKRQFKPTHVQVSLLISIFKLYASQFQRDISTTIPEQQAMADRRGKENIDILNRLLTLYSSLDHPGNHLHLLHSLCHSYDSLICLYPLRIGVELEAKKDVASPFLRDLITCIAQVCDDDPKLFGKVNEMMGTILEDYRKAFLSDILKLPVKLKGDEYSVFIQLAKWGLMDESIISHLHNLFIDEMKFWSMEDFSRLLQQISSLKLEREKFAALNWLSPLFQTRVSLDREMSYSSIEKKQKDFAEKWTVLVLMYEVSKSLRCTENRLLIFQKLMSVYLEIGVGLSALEEFNSNFLSNVLEDVLASRCGNHQFFTLFLQLLIDFARLDPTKFLESAIRLLEKIVVEVGARDDGNISILRQLSLSLITFAKLEEAHNQAQRTRFSCLVPLIIEIQQKSFNENQECLAEAVTTWAEIGKEELDFKVLNLQVRTGEVVKTSRMVVAVVSMYSRLFRKDRKGVELEENERHDLLTGPPADIYRNVLPNYLGGTEYLALRAVNRSFASLLWGPLTHLLAWIKGLERKEEPKDLINQLKQDLKALPSPSIFSNQVLSILEVEGDNEQCA